MNRSYYYSKPSWQDLGILNFNLCTPSQRLHYFYNKKLKETAKNRGISDSNSLNRRELIYILSFSFKYEIKGQFKKIPDDQNRIVYSNGRIMIIL